jgi:hypothetical protein
MKFEMAATDAGQSRNPQAGLETAPGNVSRLAPFAARLEVRPWVSTECEVPLSPRLGIENRKSQINIPTLP